MLMSHPVDTLLARLSRSMEGFSHDEEGPLLELTDFRRLAARAEEVGRRFDFGKPPEPPQKQRISALNKLRKTPEEMTPRDWRLVSWGLCDECGTFGRPIDDSMLFPRVYRYVDQQVTAKSLTRKIWFGLTTSYFSYPVETLESNKNWVALREQILRGFRQIARKQRQQKTWIQVISKHLDLFGDKPGQSLGKALADGNDQDVSELQQHLQIPGASWLWRRVIELQIEALAKMSDKIFVQRIDGLLRLMNLYPAFADQVLAGVLSRYATSELRGQAHPQLKSAALDRWGSPQLGTARNRWSVHVSDDVCRMVMRWFAKEDLESFFKLLQGERGVDQNRLDYWLRFVDQMGYTRIVLGNAARNDRSRDFVEFREKNNSRLSHLDGGTAEDNAFIMEIGGYYFVEFSKKGNACYYYSRDRLPFNVGQKKFRLADELKQPQSGYSRARSGNKFNHMSGWESNADAILAQLGIYPDHQASKSRNTGAKAHHVSEPNPKTASSGAARANSAIEGAIAEALRIMGQHSISLPSADRRPEGGAFWFFSPHDLSAISNHMKKIGFRYAAGRGYWIT